jgi:hypothetical protein
VRQKVLFAFVLSLNSLDSADGRPLPDGVQSRKRAKLTFIDILRAPFMAVAAPKMAHHVNRLAATVNPLPQICLSVVYLFARFAEFWDFARRDQPPHAMLFVGKLKFTRSKARPLGASDF